MDFEQEKLENTDSPTEDDMNDEHENDVKTANPKKDKRWYNNPIIHASVITGTFAIFASIIAIIPNLRNESKEYIIDHNNTKKENKPKIETELLAVSDESLQRKIMDQLHNSEIEKSLQLWESMQNNKLKQEELRHIFDYCLQEKKYELAENLIQLFDTKKMQEEAEKDLDLELLKQ